MNEQKLIDLLTSARNRPELGGDISATKKQKTWHVIANAIGADEQPSVSYGFSDWMNYALWTTRHVFVRPLAVGVSTFLLIFGGWVGAVNASFDSLPGEILYPVKVVTERIQLTLAASPQRRVKLHTQFASRRLQEVTVLTQTSNDQTTDRVKQAVSSFQKELTEASESLEKTKQQSPEELLQVASAIEDQHQRFESIIEQSQQQTDVSEEVKQDVARARDAVREAEANVVEAIVKTHEDIQTHTTATVLEKSFQKRYQSIKQRIALSFGRLQVIEAVLNDSQKEDTRLDYRSRIQNARVGVVLHEKSIRDSEDSVAKKAYRRGFEILDEIDRALTQSEAIILQLEIELSTTSSFADTTQEQEDAITE